MFKTLHVYNLISHVTSSRHHVYNLISHVTSSRHCMLLPMGGGCDELVLFFELPLLSGLE